MKTQKCPECKSTNVGWKEEELLCNKCGLVISEVYYSGRGAL